MLDQALAAGLSLIRADRGDIQIADASGALRIAANQRSALSSSSTSPSSMTPHRPAGGRRSHGP
jgi:hypothetical protein